MRVRCPNCSHPIELVGDSDMADLSCPSCGSHVNLSGSDEETITAMFTGRVPALQCFELLEPIGAGQFGRVWRARDTELERIVAVKVPHRKILSGDDAGFIVREARAAAQLQHPNIVTVFEVGRQDETVYIVSEYVEGVALSNWMRHYDPDAKECAQLCSLIARALEHAHENRVVHRDLKPGNIVMDRDRQPHLTDFGLAKREGGDVTIAATGQILGTPAYIAPEQILDGHCADCRSDVFSLGVILYELLTGKRPFVGGKRMLLQQVLYDDPRPPRSINRRIPKDLETICLKAMAKKPEERYQTAAQMADDLDRYLSGQPIHARRVSPPMRVLRWAQRRPAVATSVVLAVIAVGLLLTLVFTPATEPGPSPDARQVFITTSPSDAFVHLVPLNDRSGRPELDRAVAAGKSPVTTICEPGEYLVVAFKNDDLFHEVYRHVPAKHEKLPGLYPHQAWAQKDDVVSWPTIQLFTTPKVVADMVRVLGGTFIMPSVDLAGETEVTVPDLYIDAAEVTIGQVARAGLNIPVKLQMQNAAPAFELPVHDVTWHEAVYYAEQFGKRLVSDEAFQFIATQGGSVENGDGWQLIDETVPGPVTSDMFDRLDWSALSKPVIGMRSNVSEWTANWYAGTIVGTHQRIVRGGYSRELDANRNRPPPRQVHFAPLSSPQVGFRCARSARPSVRAEDLVQLRTLGE